MGVNIRTLFHLIASSIYVYTCWFDYNLVKGELLPIPQQFFSKFVWLTLIDLYLQTFYHLYGIIISVYGSCKYFDFLSKVIAGPIGMSVVFLFWGLFFADPDFLLHDETAKKILSITWYNNAIHTLPAITILIDLYLWNHGSVKKSSAVIAIAVFAILYLIDIHYVHYLTGFWAYPILGALPLPARALFIVACVAVFYVFFIFLDVTSKQLHPQKHRAGAHHKTKRN